jgi:hypothetical protein
MVFVKILAFGLRGHRSLRLTSRRVMDYRSAGVLPRLCGKKGGMDAPKNREMKEEPTMLLITKDRGHHDSGFDRRWRCVADVQVEVAASVATDDRQASGKIRSYRTKPECY